MAASQADDVADGEAAEERSEEADEDMPAGEEDDAEEESALAAALTKGRSKDKKIAKDKSGKAGKTGKVPESRSASVTTRSGLTFPVHRFAKQLKKGGYAKRLAIGGSIYLTAVIEYVTAEILELAGNSAKDQNKVRILPRHIQLAVRNDEELNKYMDNVTIASGGVLPHIHARLQPQKKAAGKEAATGTGVTFSQEF